MFNKRIPRSSAALPDLRSGKYSLYDNSRLSMPARLPPLSCNMCPIPFYFLNLLRPIPVSPTSPAPKRSMVVGSGTGLPLRETLS